MARTNPVEPMARLMQNRFARNYPSLLLGWLMRQRVRFPFAFLIVATFSGQPQAATIAMGGPEGCDFELRGEIEPEDLERLQNSGITNGDTLCLMSPGGSFSIGLDIAEWLVGRSIETFLPEDAECYSSCAIIFMGGSEWEEITIPRRRMHYTASLGFHAPYLEIPAGVYDRRLVSEAYANGLKAVSRMMKLGTDRGSEGTIPNRVILELLENGPSELYRVDSVVRSNELNIVVDGLPLTNWTPQNACNACRVYHEGNATVDACESYQMRQPENHITEFIFDGFAAEGGSQCVVRLTEGVNPKIMASIAPFGSFDGELVAKDFKELQTTDGTSPDFKLGKPMN